MRARRSPLRRLALLCVVLATALSPLACGDDEGTDGGAARTQTTTTTEPPRVVVQAANDGFNPVQVYNRAAPGVVTVLSVFGGDGDLLGETGAGQGSGFVLNEEGEIVTNAHVVTQGSDLQEADRVFIEFADRNRVPAEVLGADPFADVALLKIDPAELDLVPLRLGDDSELQVGAPVAAIGSPFGEQQSLSLGIVSAIERSVRSLTQFRIENAIQTDAAINPGNSGGPLLDAAANVIGINQQIETRSEANAGVGFAIPISMIKRSIDQLRANGEARYAYIGVSSQALYPQLAERLGLETDRGGLIARVVEGGPADDAGLQGSEDSLQFQASRVRTGGDVILAVDGKQVIDPSDLSQFIAQHRPGERVTLEILRDGERQELDVTLGSRPSAVSG